MFVKICGITTEEDALLAVAVGADALGFVFAPSKRQVTAQVAADIVKRLPPGILTVGVFRDEAPKRVIKLMHSAGLVAAQLHGRESAADVAAVREGGINIVLKGVAAGSVQFERAKSYGADAVLIDAPTPGSGELYDWSLAENAPVGLKIIMAGGLNPDNVADAIKKVQPWGVDVSSGVESGPGRKDPNLVRDFVTNAKSAYVPSYEPSGAEPYDWQEDSSWR